MITKYPFGKCILCGVDINIHSDIPLCPKCGERPFWEGLMHDRWPKCRACHDKVDSLQNWDYFEWHGRKYYAFFCPDRERLCHEAWMADDHD